MTDSNQKSTEDLFKEYGLEDFHTKGKEVPRIPVDDIKNPLSLTKCDAKVILLNSQKCYKVSISSKSDSKTEFQIDFMSPGSLASSSYKLSEIGKETGCQCHWRWLGLHAHDGSGSVNIIECERKSE